jgi:hypothetical protein
LRERRSAYKIVIRKSEGRRLLGRPRRKWEYTNKMYLKEIGGGVWIGFIWLKNETTGCLL